MPEITIYCRGEPYTLLYDIEDEEIANKCHAHVGLYSYNCVRFYHDGKPTLFARYILNITDSKIHVDHMNGNPLDNRKSNLRQCTTKQNNRNKDVRKYYYGIHDAPSLNQYQVTISIDEKRKHCYFDNLHEAIKHAYPLIQQEWGEFRRDNRTQEQVLQDIPDRNYPVVLFKCSRCEFESKRKSSITRHEKVVH